MQRAHDAARAAARKWRKSLDQHGWRRTLLRTLGYPWQVLRCGLVELRPGRIGWRRSDRQFDRTWGVDTSGGDRAAWLAQIASPNWKHGQGYAPIPAPLAEAVLRHLPIRHDQYVFVDYGSGKGRMLLVAGEYPFRRVIGVEYAPALHAIAEQNLAVAPRSRLACADVSSVLMDATQFELPGEPLVLYFHHPFEAPVFREVLLRLERSLVERPRPAWVLYHDPRCAALFDESACLSRHSAGIDAVNGLDPVPFAIYQSRDTAEVAEPAECGLAGVTP